MELYVRVRRACMVEGMSTREAARVFGLHRDTVRKMLEYSVPPGYRRQSPPRRPKLDPYHGVIDRILEEDRSLPRKQRHTAKRIYERLRAEHGFSGKYTIVKDYVRERRLRTREMYVPLSHPPGDAQCDFGQAKAVIGGVEQTIHYFVLDLPHSDACFVKAYPAETTEAFCDGHVSAFSFLGGVPRSILYDNTRVGGGQDTGRRSAEAYSCVLRARVALPVRGPVRPVPARVTTRARSRGWWDMLAGTSWCLCRRSRASMRSTPISRRGVWNGWGDSCVGTGR